MANLGAGPMVEWLSWRALLRWPRVSLVWILGADMTPLIKPCVGSVPQPEGPTTGTYNCVLGGLWGGEEEGGKKRLATDVS